MSQGGDSLPREATRSSSLCVVALATESRRLEEAERSCCGEGDDEDVGGVVGATNVADVRWGAEEAARSAAPETTSVARKSCAFFNLRAI